MWLFLFFALPLSWFVQSYGVDSGFRLPDSSWFGFLFGLIAGLVVLLLLYFIGFSYYTVPLSFLKNWFHFALFGTLIPMCLCTALFVAVYKGDLPFKLSLIPSVLSGFFVFYMPAFTIGSYRVMTPFLLFGKPVLFVAMLLYCRFLLPAVLSSFGKSAVQAVLSVLLFLVAVLIPAALEAVCAAGCSAWLWIVLSVLYCAGCAGVRFVTVRFLL